MPLYEAVLEALHAVTDGVAPVVLALEDLHWADAPRATCCGSCSPGFSDERLLVVGTYRTDDLHRRHPLRPLLAELVRLPRVERVDVAPFDAARAARVPAVCCAATSCPAPLVEDIRGRSEGNAYYAEELLAAPPTTGRGRVAARAARRRAARPPRAAAPAVQQLRAGSRPSRAGGSSDALLRAALELPVTEVDEALREAVAHHVLVADGTDALRVPARAAAGGRLRRPAARRAGPAARHLRTHPRWRRRRVPLPTSPATASPRTTWRARWRPRCARPSRPPPCWRPPRRSATTSRLCSCSRPCPPASGRRAAEPVELGLRAAAAAAAAGELHRASRSRAGR